VLEGELQGVERAGPWAFSSAWLARLEGEIRTQIDASDPIDPGVPAPVEPWAGEILPLLPFERRGAKLYLPGAQASLGARESEAQRLLAMLDAAGVSASRVQDPELARFLESRGELVRLGDGFAIGAGGYEAAKDALVRECREAGEITLSRFRDLLGTGRRDAQLLLERFDQDGLTRRIGDKRILRRAARVDAGTS
jgi:hypothetical protein